MSQNEIAARVTVRLAHPSVQLTHSSWNASAAAARRWARAEEGARGAESLNLGEYGEVAYR